MVPLLLCSLVSLTVIIERLFWGPTKSRVMPPQLMKDASSLLNAGRIEELTGLCRAGDSPLARILYAGLRNLHRPRPEIMEAMEIVGRKEALALQKNVSTLGAIAAVGPLLGLLGTVFGMISTFKVISEHGTGNPGLMAEGIAEALIATATGLAVAIPSLLFNRYFMQRARSLVVEMEVAALALFDDLQGQEAQPAPKPVPRDPQRGVRQ